MKEITLDTSTGILEAVESHLFWHTDYEGIQIALKSKGTKRGKTRVKRGKTLRSETGSERAKNEGKKGARKSGGMTEKK